MSFLTKEFWGQLVEDALNSEPAPYEMEYLDPLSWDPDTSCMKYFNGEIYVVHIDRTTIYFNDPDYSSIEDLGEVKYATYLMMQQKGRWLESWEYVYHINRDWKDDRLENLEIIDTTPQPIEVKYPYDPEKYHGTINWDKRRREYIVNLYLKKEYRHDINLEKRIRLSLKTYTVETEILNRILEKDETIIFKDKNKLNCNKDNLKIRREGELEDGERYPIDEYVCTKQLNYKGNRYIAHIYVKGNIEQSRLGMGYARWVMTKHLGRWLTDNEEVHHKDNNTLNDDISNLKLLSVDRHQQITSHEIDQLVPKLRLTCFNCSGKFLKRVAQYIVTSKDKYIGYYKQYYCSRKCYREHKLEDYDTIDIDTKAVKCTNCQKKFNIPLESEYIITNPLLENKIFCCKKCAEQYYKKCF